MWAVTTMGQRSVSISLNYMCTECMSVYKYTTTVTNASRAKKCVEEAAAYKIVHGSMSTCEYKN